MSERLGSKPLRIATRSSRLALRQAETVATALRARNPKLQIELVPIRSMGDQKPTHPIADLGQVGIFTREIERALLEGRADAAVHSLKDLPTEDPQGLRIAAVLRRVDARDVLIAATALDSLPTGARIGTSSLRRRAELLRARPDLEIVALRGNVPTRIEKMERGEVDGIVIAYAGLLRLGLRPSGLSVLDPDTMLPAPAQGAVAVQVRSEDTGMLEVVGQVNDATSRTGTTAERTVLRDLEGGCRIPLGALARFGKGTLTLHARLLTSDGGQMIEQTATGSVLDPEDLGHQVAATMRDLGAGRILEKLRVS